MGNTKGQNRQPEWTLPVSFHFRVDFQRQSSHFKVSFMEVSGLDLKLETQPVLDGMLANVKVPTGASHGNITFRRALSPLSEGFTEWIEGCLHWSERKDGYINPYDAVIKLLTPEGKPLAGWLCRHAYPIEWNLDKLDASGSSLSAETIVMTYTSIKRLTIK